MSIEKNLKKIIRADESSFINRVAWKSLESIVINTFNKYKNNKYVKSSLNGIEIKINPPIGSGELLYFQHINSVHVYTGTRYLGLSGIDIHKACMKPLTERNAQLWFAQGPSGQVMVFISAFSTNAIEIEEREILIGKYYDPTKVSISKVEQHFKTFFKYCSCTSVNSSNNFHNFMYRKYLTYSDFRNRNSTADKLINIFEKTIILLSAMLTILFTIN